MNFRALPALTLLAGLTVLPACSTTFEKIGIPLGAIVPSSYGPIEDDDFPIAAVRPGSIRPRYFRREVEFPTDEKPGTIIVDTDKKFLYFVLENDTAMRYGIGVGKAGYQWAGRANIRHLAEWPRWTPPLDMIEREPGLAEYADGMEGSQINPLGARALYLFEGAQDTMFRIHGTNEPWSIGKAMSSGCIRLLNQDIIDLYDRVERGAEVVVVNTDAELQALMSDDQRVAQADAERRRKMAGLHKEPGRFAGLDLPKLPSIRLPRLPGW